jgi:hypothetical protein
MSRLNSYTSKRGIVTASDLSSCLCSSNILCINIVIWEASILTVVGRWREGLFPSLKGNSLPDSVVIKRDELRLEFYD